MSGYNNTIGDPSISSQINVTDPYKLTTPNGKVVMVPPPRRHGWRIPEVINPSLQSVVPMQDRNVYTYYEQLMALKRAAVAIVEELAEMADNLVPDITPDDANKVLAVKNDGTGLEWKRSTATGLDAEVTQTDYGAHIEIINSGVKTEADIYNGTNGTDGAQGEKGDPGYSPQVAVQQLPNGVEINVTDEHGSTSAQVMNGTDGVKGDPGFSPSAHVERVTGGALVTVTDEFGTTQSMVNDGQDGVVGRDGVDGVSPTASVTQLTPNSIQFEVTDANGTTSATLTGEAGQDGVDGVSPTATVTQTQNGATVTITDKNGTTSANLTNGSNGTDGADGVSPTATVTQTQNGATVTITDKNGTTTANLTNGTDGSKGDDGFSPTASVTPTANGADITITDKNGTTSASITNGAKGDTGAGVPAGGTDGQLLVKDGSTDYATKWVDPEVAQDKQYSLDYAKENGKWYTTLTDGQNTQHLAVPDEWTQGGGSGATITEERVGQSDRTRVLVQRDAEHTNQEGALVTYKEGIGVENAGGAGSSGYINIIQKSWYPFEGGYPQEISFRVPTGNFSQIAKTSADTEIPPNGRVMVQIPITTDKNVQIEAVTQIMFQDASENPAGRDDCVIQSFGTTNTRKTLQVAVRNLNQTTTARIKIAVTCTMRQIYW